MERGRRAAAHDGRASARGRRSFRSRISASRSRTARTRRCVFVTRLDNGQPVADARVTIVNTDNKQLWRGHDRSRRAWRCRRRCRCASRTTAVPVLVHRDRREGRRRRLRRIRTGTRASSRGTSATRTSSGKRPTSCAARSSPTAASTSPASRCTSRRSSAPTRRTASGCCRPARRSTSSCATAASREVGSAHGDDEQVEQRGVELDGSGGGDARQLHAAGADARAPPSRNGNDVTEGEYDDEPDGCAGSTDRFSSPRTAGPSSAWTRRSPPSRRSRARRCARQSSAKYLFGGTHGAPSGEVVGDARTRSQHPARRSPRSFRASGIAFGYYPDRANAANDSRVAGETVTLDANGALHRRPSRPNATWTSPYRYTFEADVEDISRQHIANRVER